MTTASRIVASLALCALPLGCGSESDSVTFELRTHSFKDSEWSTPVNLGATINSPSTEGSPMLTRDGLSLYINSNRPGGFGGNDIWVAQRACGECPWSPPVNLGAVVNGPGGEAGPMVSHDGHLLFFGSDRPGGQGLGDIYVSRRADPKDDFGWGPPVPVGTDVNTAAVEAGPEYRESADGRGGTLYFNRRQTAAGPNDLYYAPMGRDGATEGPAVLIAELSDPVTDDGSANPRMDEREIFFTSNRPGGLGLADIWTSTRRSAHDPWSPAVNLGSTVNSAFIDQFQGLSYDARTLFFTSNRPGGFGGPDIWMTTRTPSGK